MTWDPNEYNLTLNAMQQDHEFNEEVGTTLTLSSTE